MDKNNIITTLIISVIAIIVTFSYIYVGTKGNLDLELEISKQKEQINELDNDINGYKKELIEKDSLTYESLVEQNKKHNEMVEEKNKYKLRLLDSVTEKQNHLRGLTTQRAEINKDIEFTKKSILEQKEIKNNKDNTGNTDNTDNTGDFSRLLSLQPETIITNEINRDLTHYFKAETNLDVALNTIYLEPREGTIELYIEVLDKLERNGYISIELKDIWDTIHDSLFTMMHQYNEIYGSNVSIYVTSPENRGRVLYRTNGYRVFYDITDEFN